MHTRINEVWQSVYRRNNNRGRGRHNFQQCQNNMFWAQQNYWTPPYLYWQSNYNQNMPMWNPFSPMNSYQGSSLTRPISHTPQAHLAETKPTADFSHAFNTETMHENGGDWYMDSSSTSHLVSSTCTLQTSLNRNVDHSIIVGNGSKISITSIGSSFIPTTIRPLSL